MTLARLYFEDIPGSFMVAGVDEAGRGALCGPVIAAAVVFSCNAIPEGITDSKRLTEKRREILYDEIVASSYAWGVGSASSEEIDDINILNASMLAMKRAVEGLPLKLDLAVVDGNKCPDVSCPVRSIVKGDSLIVEIAAASILAKVTRDRLMVELDRKHPGCGIMTHKGYPTQKHIESLYKVGVANCYRKTFKPVRKILELQEG